MATHNIVIIIIITIYSYVLYIGAVTYILRSTS